MEEIKRYRCIKELTLEKYDGDGFQIENEYTTIEPGGTWQENKWLIIGGPEHIHLDAENGTGWCEITRASLNKYFEQVESMHV